MSALKLYLANDLPLLRDSDLADKLGFKVNTQIRELIDRHKETLKELGPLQLLQDAVKPTGGRPGMAYYLTQKQALLICMKSEAQNAVAVQLEMIDVFEAYLNGKLANLQASQQIAQQPSQQTELQDLIKASIRANYEISQARKRLQEMIDEERDRIRILHSFREQINGAWDHAAAYNGDLTQGVVDEERQRQETVRQLFALPPQPPKTPPGQFVPVVPPDQKAFPFH